MKELQAMLEKAIKEGKTIEDISAITLAAQNAVNEEESQRMELEKSRAEAAAALAKYVSLVTGEEVDDVEIYMHLQEVEEEVLDIVERGGISPFRHKQPVIKMFEGKEAEDALKKLIEKLGF